jgi:hypothetical protein
MTAEAWGGLTRAQRIRYLQKQRKELKIRMETDTDLSDSARVKLEMAYVKICEQLDETRGMP